MAESPTVDARRRLAVYAAPRGASVMGSRAAAWLGRHVDRLPEPAPPSLESLTASELRELTAEPRLYGFHATLKPPFHLADGVAADDVDAEVAALAEELAAVEIPALRIDLLAGFAAFVPDEPLVALDDLASACVCRLDGCRRPADELELARRRRRGRLTPRQDELLVAWGYPYVLDEFRYHMTLTRRLAAADVHAVLDAARGWFHDLDGAPYLVDELCVVEQAAPGEAFQVRSRHTLPVR